MKLPNNYGSIVKLSGNRRKPYAVRVTQGWKHNAKNDTYTQVKKYIGYGSTRAEALDVERHIKYTKKIKLNARRHNVKFRSIQII